MLQEESLAALELDYEIQRKITSAALRLATDSSLSKAVRRQRKMLYQQSLQQLKVPFLSIPFHSISFHFIS